jgi:response regulator of citrate/malate metabolism
LGVKKYLLKPVVMTKLVDTIKSIYELDWYNYRKYLLYSDFYI